MAKQRIDWNSHFKRFESSGLKADEYCRMANLNLGTFRHNLYKHRAKGKSSEPVSLFSEIRLRSEFTVSLEDDGSVSIVGINPDYLPAILRACSHALPQ